MKKPVGDINPEFSIEEDCFIEEEGGRFVGVYLTNVLQSEVSTSRIFYNLKYQESDRTSGIHSQSLIFGSAPRDPLKRLTARRCPFNRENPQAFRTLLTIGDQAQSIFKKQAPAAWESHVSAARPISPHWFMPKLEFTSGIINSATQLIYHTDNGNMPGCFSMMYTFRHGITGGHLHLPEFNALIKTAHNSLLIFDGASVVHGVTPFKKALGSSRRVTIVYYVLEKMQRCCPDEKSEVEYQNKLRTDALWK